MSEVSSWHAGLVSAALATPVWVTVLLALVAVTTRGRLMRALRVLLLVSPPLTWVLAGFVLAVADADWVRGRTASSVGDMGWFVVLVSGGGAGLITWAACLLWIAASSYAGRLGRFLLGWPFWSIPPLLLALAWWFANRRLGMTSTYAFWIAFGGTGAWVLSALWVGVTAATGGSSSGKGCAALRRG